MLAESAAFPDDLQELDAFATTAHDALNLPLFGKVAPNANSDAPRLCIRLLSEHKGKRAGRDTFVFSGWRGTCLHVQDGMKRTLVVLALIALAGLAIWFPRILTARVKSNPRAQPVAMTSCVDRYNSLLKHAKSALAAGDRSSTVKLLQRAKSLITVCPALQDPQSSTSIISF